MDKLYLYRAPLDWLAQRLVAASAHPIRSHDSNQPPGLTPQRVTLRWAPAAGGAIRTHRGLLWTSHQSPLALAGYQRAGQEALLQFRPTRRAVGDGRHLRDSFPAPVDGAVSATAVLANEHMMIRGRVGQTPFLRYLAAPGLAPGRWSVRALREGRQVQLILGPPDRPPIGARILSVQGRIEGASAEALSTGHLAIAATLAMEAEWLDEQGRRRVTDWQLPIRHLCPWPDPAPGELVGIHLVVEELRWASDRPVWALLRAQLARYSPAMVTLLPTYQSPTLLLVGCDERSFAWSESESSPIPAQLERLEIPFSPTVARLVGLEMRPGALDLLVGLRGGGLHLLRAAAPWGRPPTAVTLFALPGRLLLQG